ncbi:ATP-binding protein [Kitasatospora sp. NPDC049258]|uniref:ATP-binding protein n=1 Tax=Kitasatospora sp. NPDC049258 TaxID=3155394 RepID=UPI00343461C6
MIDDAVLILSELLSNSCRYARPLALLAELDRDAELPVGRLVTAGGTVRLGSAATEPSSEPSGDGDADGEAGGVLVRWQTHGDGLLTLEVTDGGAVTRPLPARPSVTARGGRGLNIVGELASDWGVRHAPGRVTVWAELPADGRRAPGPAVLPDTAGPHARSA